MGKQQFELHQVNDKEVTEENYRPREQWTNKTEFILSCIGFSVGLGNVWRFPYLCYKNGGGAFLIPYFFCVLTGGVPMYFLEVGLGQFMNEGGISAWKIMPIFKGIGYGTTIIVFWLNNYYIIIMAWALLYMFYSFTSQLPWATCGNWWNTDKCSTFDGSNTTAEMEADNHTRKVDAVVEFWENRVLGISSGIDDIGTVQWQLAISLLLSWLIVYFCIWKGVKSSGKAVYFTATFPYVMLTVLLIRGCTLDGAWEGIKFYLNPDFTKLADAQVWIDAGTQIFFSYAIALGCMIALGSYNKFTNDFVKDCTMICACNSFTSLYSGFVIFSVLGFMAKEQGVPVADVAESGPGLAFIAYPKAVSKMPVAPLWSSFFFFMILLLGLDSQFVGVEGFITAIVDIFPHILRVGYRREYFIAATAGVSYLVGQFMITNGGMYVFQLFDYYSASGMVLLWFCFWECIAIGWFYGANRFYDNIEMMTGRRILPWLKICWLVITPVVTMGILLFSFATHKSLTYNRTYVYPAWAEVIGWLMALISMVIIPVYFIYKLFSYTGSLPEKFKQATTPILKEHQLRPRDKEEFYTGVFTNLKEKQNHIQ